MTNQMFDMRGEKAMNRNLQSIIALGILALGMNLMAEAATPQWIEHTAIVPADQEAVWQRWTTSAGLTTFFSRASNVELKVGGDYEIFFFPDNPPGSRGAEGTRVMAIEAPHRLAFDWDAPPKWPAQRGQRTMVEVRLLAIGDTTKAVSYTHLTLPTIYSV